MGAGAPPTADTLSSPHPHPAAGWRQRGLRAGAVAALRRLVVSLQGGCKGGNPDIVRRWLKQGGSRAATGVRCLPVRGPNLAACVYLRLPQYG